MALKAINDKAGTFGARVREIVNRHASLANKLAAKDALLPTFALLGGSPALKLGEAAPAKPALSGCALADTPEAQRALAALSALVALPTDAEIDAASGGLLDAADRAAVKAAIRCEAVLRYVAESCAARLPANDV